MEGLGIPKIAGRDWLISDTVGYGAQGVPKFAFMDKPRAHLVQG